MSVSKNVTVPDGPVTTGACDDEAVVVSADVRVASSISSDASCTLTQRSIERSSDPGSTPSRSRAARAR